MDRTLSRIAPASTTPDPQDDVFSVEHLKDDLKARSIRSGSATMAGQFVKFVLHTGSVMILARLLTKEDFGVVGMVLAVTNFIMMFKDMGLSMATIQRPQINQRQISTLFWINAAIGLALALLTVALAPVVAWFYGEPRLTAVTMLLGAGFIFSGLTIQHQALLKRNMRFGAVATIEVVAMLCSVIVAVVTAWRGGGYWSLALMHLTMGAIICAGVWIALRWRPGPPRRDAGARAMLGFGKNITAFHIVNYFARNADKVLIGRFCGAVTLGLYGRAYGLLMLPISQIRGPLTSVATPALSRLQNDAARYRKYYTKLVLLLSFMSMPVTVLLAVCAEDVIAVVLGDKWLQAASIFQVLALTAFIQPVSTTTGTVMLSMGQSKRFLALGLFNSAVIVASFGVGIRWGAVGVALAYATATYVLLIPSLWYSYRETPVMVRDFFKAIIRSAVASIVMGTCVMLGRRLLAIESNLSSLVTCLFVGLLGYLLTWIVMPTGMSTLREIRAYADLMRHKGQTRRRWGRTKE